MAQKCVHQGCGKNYTDEDEVCRYHPGPPVFHEGQKGMVLRWFFSSRVQPSGRSYSLQPADQLPIAYHWVCQANNEFSFAQDGRVASPVSSPLRSS